MDSVNYSHQLRPSCCGSRAQLLSGSLAGVVQVLMRDVPPFYYTSNNIYQHLNMQMQRLQTVHALKVLFIEVLCLIKISFGFFLLMVFYLVKREEAYFLLDALTRLLLSWATGRENWDGIILAGQNRGRQVTSGTIYLGYISFEPYIFHFPILSLCSHPN